MNEEIKNEIQKLKSEAFDIRALLDQIQTQGTQLSDVYNKKIADITAKENELKKIEEQK